MSAESVLKTLQACRGFFQKAVNDLSEEQLLEVPDGSNNNVLWNMGHIVYSNCGMTYRRCGLDMPIPEAYIDLFKAGSSPSDWADAPPVKEVVDHFNTGTAKICEDYRAGVFKDFEAFELMPGYKIESIEDVLAFNIFHESVHIGITSKLIKQLNTVSA